MPKIGKSLLLPLLLVFLSSTALHAQLYLKGDTLFQKKAYFQALDFYQKALEETKDSTIGCHCKRRIAECYGQLQNYAASAYFYKDLVKTCNTDLTDVRNWARTLQQEGEYEKAKKLFASCYSADSTDQFSFANMHVCDTIQLAMDRITDVYLEGIYPLNSPFDDILSEANNDTLFFLSSRKLEKKESKLGSNNQYTFKMLQWHPLQPDVLRSQGNWGNGFASADAEQEEFFLAQNEISTSRPTHSRSVIYRRRATVPNASQKFVYDDSLSNFGHPNLSPDGTMFFFVSDRPGGFGGMDLYYCKKNGTKWSPPINLGPSVNTPYNELLPFYLGEGLLLFSSNGHGTFGGYDVYATSLKGALWNFPHHLPLPINSRFDDIGFRWDKTKKTFYLTSNRANGKGAFDIYKVLRFDVEDLKQIR